MGVGKCDLIRWLDVHAEIIFQYAASLLLSSDKLKLLTLDNIANRGVAYRRLRELNDQEIYFPWVVYFYLINSKSRKIKMN